MELLKEKSIHQLAVEITDDFKKSSSYVELFENMQQLVTCQSIKSEHDFRDTFVKCLQENGFETKISNSVFYWMREQDIVNPKQKAGVEAFLKKYQSQWDKRIYKSLNSMCSELGISLAKLRSPAERDELIEKWGELSNYDVDIHKYRPVYAPKDFLDVLLGLKMPRVREPLEFEPSWQFSYLPIRVKLLPELRTLYKELARGEILLGLSLPLNNWPLYYTYMIQEMIDLGEKVLAQHKAPVAQEYLKKGCPGSLRAKMWSLVMDSEINQSHCNHFQMLKESVLQYDLMIDKLIIKDIHLTASNDDQYFVYEDVLYQVMLCFSRDNEVMSALSNSLNLMHVVLKGKIPIQENSIVFPPSGVIPFHGFSMLAAPLCYLYDNPVQLYYTFRAFYLRYWHRLHRVCSHPQGIVSLCLLYERLLQCYEPFLWHHFKKLQIHPLRIVFKWLMRAFSGYLPPEQLLYLWDLILAYDSLEIISVLAVAILIFRKDNLMRVDTLQSVESVLADLSSIAVMPLLQLSLIPD